MSIILLLDSRLHMKEEFRLWQIDHSVLNFGLGSKYTPPLLGRRVGRSKTQRIRACLAAWRLEKQATKKEVMCKRCGGFEHFSKTCKLEMVGEDGETTTTNKRSEPISSNFLLIYVFQVCIVVTERYSQEKTIRSCHYWSFQKRLLRIRGHAWHHWKKSRKKKQQLLQLKWPEASRIYCLK